MKYYIDRLLYYTWISCLSLRINSLIEYYPCIKFNKSLSRNGEYLFNCNRCSHNVVIVPITQFLSYLIVVNHISSIFSSSQRLKLFLPFPLLPEILSDNHHILSSKFRSYKSINICNSNELYKF